MYLTKEEERIHDGGRGLGKADMHENTRPSRQLFEATRHIPIESTHVSGVSYKTLGDAPIEFLRAIADGGGKTKSKATLNLQSYDPQYFTDKLPQQVYRKQSNILRQFEKMGFTMSLTCTPYYIEKPGPGSHLAWAESFAVVYADSILGARTNREGVQVLWPQQ